MKTDLTNIYELRSNLHTAEENVKNELAKILAPYGYDGLNIAEEDATDLYQLWAEPEPNVFGKITDIRSVDGKVQVWVENDDFGRWYDIYDANVSDFQFLLDRVIDFIEEDNEDAEADGDNEDIVGGLVGLATAIIKDFDIYDAMALAALKKILNGGGF